MQCATIFTYLQACMIDRRHKAYISLRKDVVQHLRFAIWFCRTQSALVQMGAILKSAEAVWDFSLAKLDISVAAGFFAARETNVKHRRYSVLKGFADMCVTFYLRSSKSLTLRYFIFEKQLKRLLRLWTNSSQKNKNYGLRRNVHCRSTSSMQRWWLTYRAGKADFKSSGVWRSFLWTLWKMMVADIGW